ncbi:hypothetical protein BGZ59_002079 [Podila verticillata]|nr:hypothetical protein BGZ59_002079 [Podila verticillata]
MLLSGRSSEKAERRAAKTQSLYVATPSSFSPNATTTSSGFIPHHHRQHQQLLQEQQQQHQHQQHHQQPYFSSPGNSTISSPSAHTPKSPRKASRPFSMMFMPSHEETTKQTSFHQGQEHHDHTGGHDYHQHQHQHQHQHIHHPPQESDEDIPEFVPPSTVEYESDLRDVDSDTRMLISHLTDLDSGLPILLERVKQNLHSCKRSVMEAEYGTNILKLASGFRDTYRQQSSTTTSSSDATGAGSGGGGASYVKQGSYGEGWIHILEMHERMGNNRLEFSRDLQVISEELSTIYKETDRSRKQFKEAGAKQERIVQEHEQNLEKAKQKYDSSTEEWERAILQKAADPSASKKTVSKTMTINIFRQPKSVSQLHRQEEEAKAKAASTHEQYKAQLAKTNDTRQFYFARTLPNILKNLKDTIDESDLSLQYYLMRYGYMSEDYLMKDGVVLSPINGTDLGLRDRVEMINKDSDLQVFIHAYSAKANQVQRAAAPYQEYLMSAQAQSIINPHPIFGVDLAEQLVRDETDLPEIVVKCTEAIERYGMDTQGIYRVSGVTSVTNRLRSAFDRDCSAVDLSTEDNCGDVNSVASVLKTWFRDLPEPLLTRRLYPEFIKAAAMEDPALQLMNLHQCTNQLPDPNYATLKFLMCHLNRIQANQAINKMGASNLGLIFGPTLTSSSGGGAVDDLADMGLQCRIIETLLANYGAIFDIDDDEEEEEEGAIHYEQHHHQDGVVPVMQGEEGYYGSQMMDGAQDEYHHHHHHQQQQQGVYHQGYDYPSYPSRHRQSVYGIQEEEDDEEQDDVGAQFLEPKSRVPGSNDVDLVP